MRGLVVLSQASDFGIADGQITVSVPVRGLVVLSHGTRRPVRNDKYGFSPREGISCIVTGIGDYIGRHCLLRFSPREGISCIVTFRATTPNIVFSGFSPREGISCIVTVNITNVVMITGSVFQSP